MQFDFAYREESYEWHETSANVSPPDILAAEIMIADDGENIHDDEQKQDCRGHPLRYRFEEGHDENLKAADVVQDAKDADYPQRADDAESSERRIKRYFHELQTYRH